MAIKGYFFNAVQSGGVYDRIYNAEDVTSYLSNLVSNGVFADPAYQLQVRASSGMQVIVNEGEGWINGHKIVNTEDMILSVDSSDILLDRKDRVICYLDLSTREMGIEVKKGTPSSTPSAPALTRNGERYELGLAIIKVNHGISSITNSMISDSRPNSAVCGFVRGLVEQVDTEDLFLQYEAAYAEQLEKMNEWEAEMETSFNNWFSTLTETLNVNTYIKSYQKDIEISRSTTGYTTTLDMSGYSYREDDIIDVYINGMLSIKGSGLRDDWDGSFDGNVYTITFNHELLSGTRIMIRVLKAKIGDPILGSSGTRELHINNTESSTSTDSAEGEVTP
jgi:hypothetical protein